MKDFPPKNTVSHQVTFKVKASDIDVLNHVNNIVYLQWVNEISELHWGILSNNDINKKYFWVAIRHEIDYLQQAFLDDEITIYTWIGETGGVKSIRNVHIYNGKTLLVKAKTTWCLMDAKTLKPTRIKEDITNLFILEGI